MKRFLSVLALATVGIIGSVSVAYATVFNPTTPASSSSIDAELYSEFVDTDPNQLGTTRVHDINCPSGTMLLGAIGLGAEWSASKLDADTGRVTFTGLSQGVNYSLYLVASCLRVN